MFGARGKHGGERGGRCRGRGPREKGGSAADGRGDGDDRRRAILTVADPSGLLAIAVTPAAALRGGDSRYSSFEDEALSEAPGQLWLQNPHF